MGAKSYADAGSTYRNTSVDRTALDRLMELTGGVRVSSHVPAVSGNKQNAVVRVGGNRDMVAPIWSGISLIVDEITKAKAGQIVITAVMLHAVKLLRSGWLSQARNQHLLMAGLLISGPAGAGKSRSERGRLWRRLLGLPF